MATAWMGRQISARGTAISRPATQPSAPPRRAHSSGTRTASVSARTSSKIKPTTPASSPESTPLSRAMPHVCVRCGMIERLHAAYAPQASCLRVLTARRNAPLRSTATTSALTLTRTPRTLSPSRKRASRHSGWSSRRLTSHSMRCRGRKRSKWRTAASTPSSARMRSPSFLAASRIFSSALSTRRPSARRSALSMWIGHGSGPTPARRTISPQKCWSPKKGQTKVGLPCRSPAAVVPAPPWWTTAATLGSSWSCGHGPMS
mmetsp:Transcript_22445/g.57692  ORF Transcript_22445/g.57692 Transcript_22445/m.57692 type:complete len:261 (+) Transcript_22445:1528-2310(+)